MGCCYAERTPRERPCGINSSGDDFFRSIGKPPLSRALQSPGADRGSRALRKTRLHLHSHRHRYRRKALLPILSATLTEKTPRDPRTAKLLPDSGRGFLFRKISFHLSNTSPKNHFIELSVTQFSLVPRTAIPSITRTSHHSITTNFFQTR